MCLQFRAWKISAQNITPLCQQEQIGRYPWWLREEGPSPYLSPALTHTLSSSSGTYLQSVEGGRHAQRDLFPPKPAGTKHLWNLSSRHLDVHLHICAWTTLGDHGMIGLEGTFRGHPLSLDQVAQRPIQPGCEHFQRWSIHSFSRQPLPMYYTLISLWWGQGHFSLSISCKQPYLTVPAGGQGLNCHPVMARCCDSHQSSPYQLHHLYLPLKIHVLEISSFSQSPLFSDLPSFCLHTCVIRFIFLLGWRFFYYSAFISKALVICHKVCKSINIATPLSPSLVWQRVFWHRIMALELTGTTPASSCLTSETVYLTADLLTRSVEEGPEQWWTPTRGSSQLMPESLLIHFSSFTRACSSPCSHQQHWVSDVLLRCVGSTKPTTSLRAREFIYLILGR